MSVAVAVYDVKQETFAPASEAGPAPKRIVVAFGFWVFLLSDIVMDGLARSVGIQILQERKKEP